MFSLGDVLVNIKADTSDLKKGLGDVQDMGTQTKSLGEKVSDGLNTAAKGLAVVGAGLTIYAKSATNYTEQFYKDSKALGTQLGVTTTDASKLVAGVGRMGISAQDASQLFGIFEKKIQASSTAAKDHELANEKLQIAIEQTKNDIVNTTKEIQNHGDKTGNLNLKIKDLNATLQEQQNQLKTGQDAFARLGITTVDAQGKQRGFRDILGDVADKFKSMPNGVEKTATAMELFGRQGKDMIKILNLGSQGIQDLETQADKMGLTLNAKTIVSIQKLITAQKDLKQQTEALKIAVGTETAPVLTKFDQIINGLVRTMLNAPEPIRGITTGFLAFGGPIATAASGVAAFGANMVQAWPAIIRVGQAVGSLVFLLQGPWALAIAAVTLGIVALIDHFSHHTSVTDQLRNATQKLTDANNGLHDAQESVKNSSLDLQGAQLNLEGAQRDYNRAVADYGPNSLEARQAAYQVQRAQEDVDRAQQGVKSSLQQLHEKEQEVAKDKTLIKHLQETAASADGVSRSAMQAGQKIDLLNGRRVTVKTTKGAAGNSVIDFTSTFRAKGGPVKKGQPYVTGEEGQELFLPNQDGTIIPHDMTNSFIDNLMSVGDMLKHLVVNGPSAFMAQPAMASANAGVQYGDLKVYGDLNIGNKADADYLAQKVSGQMNRSLQVQKMGGSRL